MRKTLELEDGLDGVRQLLLNVETRKSNFDYNVILLERQKDLLRLKSTWEAVCNEGPESERGRARYLVNKSIIASQCEIQRSVDKGLREEKLKIQDSKRTRGNRNSVKSVISSRLLRAKSSSCERCLKKNQQLSPSNKLKTKAGSRESVVAARNRKAAPDESLDLAKMFVVDRCPPTRHFPTRFVLTKKAGKEEEAREIHRKNIAFVPLSVLQRNSIPTSCKATSTTSMPESENKSAGSRNVGTLTVKHESAKLKLKIQVLPSTNIRPSMVSRQFTNARYTEIAREDGEGSKSRDRVTPTKAAPLKDDTGPTTKRHGRILLTKELSEKIMAVCKEKMLENASSQIAVENSAEKVENRVEGDERPTGFNDEMLKREENDNREDKPSVLDSQSERSSSLGSQEFPLVSTPVLTPAPSPVVSPAPPQRVHTPTLSRSESLHESESEPESEVKRSVRTPEPSLTDSASLSKIHAFSESSTSSPEEMAAPLAPSPSPANPAENEDAVSKSKSLPSKCETSASQMTADGESFVRPEYVYSVGEIRFKLGQSEKWRKEEEPKSGGSEESSSDVPKMAENSELDADITTCTNFSEGEVRPFCLHRMLDFERMLAILNLAQSARRTDPRRRNVSREEISLGEVTKEAPRDASSNWQPKASKHRSDPMSLPKESLSEGEILDQSLSTQE